MSFKNDRIGYPVVPSRMPARRRRDLMKAPGVFSLCPPGGALWGFRRCTPCTETASAGEEALDPVPRYHGDQLCTEIQAHLVTVEQKEQHTDF